MDNKDKTFSTGDIARYCGVNYVTVCRWIDSGRIKGYQLPGRGDRRVYLKDFIEFLQKNNMPINNELIGHPPRILIVDDDYKMAKSIQRVLRKINFDVLTATDGFMAGHLLTHFKPSIMTLDICMPGLNGVQVLEIVRSVEDLKHIKILIITAMLDPDVNHLLSMGADGVLKKPFDNKDLISRIKKMSKSGSIPNEQ